MTGAGGGVPLEPDPDQLLEMGAAALELVGRFVAGLPDAPAADLDVPAPLLEAARRPPGEDGRPFTELLDQFEAAAGKGFETAGPGYFAFIPGGGLPSAAVADLLACSFNRFVNLAAPAPALAQLEATAVRWMCDLFGMPPASQGILTSGGSIANLSAVLAARHALLPPDFLRGTVYVSEHAHHSVAKAARLAGFPATAVRTVACTPDLRLDPAALRRAVAEDRAAGSSPFLLVASAGTTDTGAVDDLAALGDVALAERLWYHVDAAYGGFFQLTARGRARFAGIERADSVTLDPHKGMFLPYGTGCLLVRDGERLRAAHSGTADAAGYLAEALSVGDVPNFSEYSAELSRDFRGLRVWLPLQLHGVRAFREALDEKLDLAEEAFDALRRVPGLEVPWRPDLSIVAFRCRPDGFADPEAATRAVLAAVNASGRVFLSSTVVAGRLTLRLCILSFRTHRDRVLEAVALVREAVARLRAA